MPDLDLESLCKAPDTPCVFFVDILEMGAAQADCWEHVPSKCSVARRKSSHSWHKLQRYVPPECNQRETRAGAAG